MHLNKLELNWKDCFIASSCFPRHWNHANLNHMHYLCLWKFAYCFFLKLSIFSNNVWMMWFSWMINSNDLYNNSNAIWKVMIFIITVTVISVTKESSPIFFGPGCLNISTNKESPSIFLNRVELPNYFCHERESVHIFGSGLLIIFATKESPSIFLSRSA